MAKRKKKRIGYAVKPPYLDLGEALRLVQSIYEDGGGSVSEDQLAAIFGNSIASSSFRLKLGALKMYGLVNQAGARIELSDVGRAFAASVTAEQRLTAGKAAFLKVENFKTLFEFWSGKLLPQQEEFFLNSIREHCKVPAELVPSWKSNFMKSAKAAGLLQERADGRLQLRREPGSTEEEPMVANGTTEKSQGIAPAPRPPAVRRDEGLVERFPIPLTGEGKSATVELPKGWTQADVRKMIHVIEAMFLWEAGAAQNKNP